MSVTAAQFDAALVQILGQRMVEAIRTRPELAKAAIYEIFMRKLETRPDYWEACEAIRYAQNSLEQHGQYKFSEPQEVKDATSFQWLDQSKYMPEGVKRQRLFADGMETPFFIDVSDRVAHRSEGQRCGLYGSGMSPSGHAKVIRSGPTITPLKATAEKLALEGW